MEFEKLLELIGEVSEETKEEIKNALLTEYERGRGDQIKEQEKNALKDAVVSMLEEAGALDTELAKSVMNMESVICENGEISGLSEEIDRIKGEYAFLFRQDCPHFSSGSGGENEVDISSLNYLERLRLFKENPDLYKLQMNK